MVAFTALVMWPFMFHMRGIAEQEGLYGTAYASRSFAAAGSVPKRAV